MSIHIQRFVDKLAGAEARQARELMLPIAEAKALHQDITRLLLALENYHVGQETKSTNEVVEIVVTGGSFKD